MDRTFLHSLLLGCLFLGLGLSACHTNSPETVHQLLSDSAQRLPQNAVNGLTVASGLKAELFASEPMITNPTNMDIDARGRVWICQAYNYRPQVNPQDPVNAAGDCIKVLEDTNGDGIADTAKIFYQGTDINAALGICVLGNKVIVSCSPNVFIFTDTNGDDKADKKELLFSYIGGHQHDHGVHAFSFGPDGKLYFNFGNEGDSILDKNGKLITDTEGNPVNKSGHPYRQGMAFRCNLDGSDLEVLGNNFRNPYEIAVDAFGNLWQSDNDDDGNRGVRMNYVVPYGNYGYTDEMTGAGWSSWRLDMEDSIPYRHWHLNDPGVVPNMMQTGSGAPCGILFYEGGLLPAAYRNQIIHADAGHNVVRCYQVKKSGAGFSADTLTMVEGTYDKWFRPVDVCAAPDGSVFIADWYDPGVGGHQVGDLQRGRVFRIAPPGYSYHITPPSLNTPEEAVNALENPNLATRYLAWEKLHNWGMAAVPALTKMYRSPNLRYRARALWLLSKLPGKGAGYIQEALKDKSEDIRITAVRAAEEIGMDTISIIRQLVSDPSPQVRRVAAIALRHNHSPEAPALWAQLASQYNGKDRWYLEALGIGADEQWDAYFAAWLQKENGEWNNAVGRDIIWRSRADAALPLLAEIIRDPQADPGKNQRYFRAFHFHPEGATKEKTLLSLLNGSHPQQALIAAFALAALDPSKAPRTTAFKKIVSRSVEEVRDKPDLFIQLAEKYKLAEKRQDLLRIVLDPPSKETRNNALNVLLQLGGKQLVEKKLHGDTATARKLLGVLRNESAINKAILVGLIIDKNYDPDLRRLATHQLGRQWTGADTLMQLVMKKRLPAALDSVAENVLLHSYRADIKLKAEAYFNKGMENNHALPPVKELAEKTGSAAGGKGIFSTYCTTCHQVNNMGTDFGPRLSEIGSKLSKEALYTAVITPDAGISFGFDGYTFTLKDGSRLEGIIASETKQEVDLKVIGGATEKIQKSNIVSRQKDAHSLMPAGFGSSLSVQQLTDLVEYLSTLKKAN